MVTTAEELKRYVRFSEDDARRLQALRDVAAPHFLRIAQAFYDRIREHDAAHAVLVDEAQVARLQRSLVAWMGRLLGGSYDDAYFDLTRRIGVAHVRVGLPQLYVPVALSLIRQELMDIADASGQEGVPETRASICRILDIELAVMTEASWESVEARLDRMGRLQDAPSPAGVPPREQRYARALEVAPLPIVGLGRAREIVIFNAEASRLTGYARDEALGRRFEDLLLARGDHAGLAALERAAPGAATVHEGDLPTRAGKVRQVRWMVGKLPEDGGSVELFHLLMAHDITEERAMQQRARAQERLAAVGTLAAGLAHEIRNPLNGAQLHLSLLQRALKRAPVDVGEAMQAAGVVRDEIQRLSKLVTDFLEFARPRSLALADVSLQDLCRRAVELGAAGRAGTVQVELDLPATEITLEGDRDRLEQALANLIENAVEAVTAGGKVIVRARREPHQAWVEVEDDGPGISGDSAQLFDAFYTTKPTGTGLGLSIAHRAVSDHGGSIHVESRPGRTRFRVTLPLRQ
jgi:PAS domain S-box-containing protein